MLFTKDQLVYVQHTELIWVNGRVIDSNSSDGVEILVEVEDSEQSTIFIPFDQLSTSRISVKNPQDESSEITDLCVLTSLNDASLLHILKRRYSEGNIYTAISDIIIAINPYSLSHEMNLYSKERMREYDNLPALKSKPPHLYKISCSAYYKLMENHRSQSILVGGESGSGKTESVKIIMEHVLSLSNHQDCSLLMSTIIISNMVLEYLGNARTVKNGNSSRYGKLLTLMFNVKGEVIGGRLKTFLLEKKRVTTFLQDETSTEKPFHALSLFEQDCSIDIIQKLLHDQEHCQVDTPPSFSLTWSLEEFIVILNRGLKLDDSEIQDLFSLMLGIRSMMEISFAVADGEGNAGSSVSMINLVAHHFGVEGELFQQFLWNKNITIRGEGCISTSRTTKETYNYRNAVASEIYALFFNWTVERINQILTPNFKSEDLEKCNERSLSLLDIFGFESLQAAETSNSIEQFLINYANEKLHYHFLQHSILLEQRLYTQEVISSILPNFTFNHIDKVLIAIEAPRGMIDLMHDQVNLQKNDQQLMNQIKQSGNSNLNDPKVLQIDKFMKHFIIHHYAGEVKYNIIGFTERNHAATDRCLLDFLSSSSNKIIQGLITVERNRKFSKGIQTINSKLSASVAKNFREELEEMIQMVNQTELSFVKCIKPNEEKAPWRFHNKTTYHQLNCNGILEAISVMRSKYPCRMTISEFSERFAALLLHEQTISALLGMILDEFNEKSSNVGECDRPPYQIGMSLVFLEQFLLDQLNIRLHLYLEKIILIQSYYRMYQKRYIYGQVLCRRKVWARKKIGIFMRNVIKVRKEKKTEERLRLMLDAMNTICERSRLKSSFFEWCVFIKKQRKYQLHKSIEEVALMSNPEDAKQELKTTIKDEDRVIEIIILFVIAIIVMLLEPN